MIPKIIHYCWFGGSPLPETAQKCIESWKKYCPDYEIRRWDESNYDISKNRYMREAYSCKRYGFVPDYARLDIIYEHGGIYLDTDVEMLRSFDPLLEHEGFCGVERGSECVALGLGFGACKGNETIRLLRDFYDDKAFVKNDMPDLTPAPKLNTQVLRGLGYTFSENITTCGGLTVYPAKYFCPVDHVSGGIEIENETFSIHHYDSSWYTARERYSFQLKKRLMKLLPKKAAGRAAFFIAQCKFDGIGCALKRTWSKTVETVQKR